MQSGSGPLAARLRAYHESFEAIVCRVSKILGNGANVYVEEVVVARICVDLSAGDDGCIELYPHKLHRKNAIKLARWLLEISGE